MFMFTTPDFLGASRKKRRNNRTGTRLRLSRSHQPGLSGNKTRGTWPMVLFAGAAEFLQLNDGSFVVVNTCANNVRRVAYPQRIANFTRALFFAWFWPPILDPYAGGGFCCFTKFGEKFSPLRTFQFGVIPADEIGPEGMGRYGSFGVVQDENVGVLPNPEAFFLVELCKAGLTRLCQALCCCLYLLDYLLGHRLFLSLAECGKAEQKDHHPEHNKSFPFHV